MYYALIFVLLTYLRASAICVSSASNTEANLGFAVCMRLTLAS